MFSNVSPLLRIAVAWNCLGRERFRELPVAFTILLGLLITARPAKGNLGRSLGAMTPEASLLIGLDIALVCEGVSEGRNRLSGFLMGWLPLVSCGGLVQARLRREGRDDVCSVMEYEMSCT